MGRNNSREKPVKRVIKDTGKKIKKKPCSLCVDSVTYISYRDLPLLRKYVSDRGKIRSRRVTGNCSQHQRDIATVVKTARELALLPYLQRTVSDKVNIRSTDQDDQELQGDSNPEPSAYGQYSAFEEGDLEISDGEVSTDENLVEQEVISQVAPGDSGEQDQQESPDSTPETGQTVAESVTG